MMMEHGTGWQRWTTGALMGLGVGLVLAGSAGASEAGGHGGIDAAKINDMIWRTVNFIVFAGILIKLLAKPAKEFFAKRSQGIAVDLDELEARKAAAKQALEEAEARLAQVAAEKDKIIAQYVAEGEMEKAKILEMANLAAQRIKEMAALTIEQEIKKGALELKQEVANLATQMAEDLLREKITYADHQDLVQEYLKKVVETH